MEMWVACVIYKLAQNVFLLICSKLFALGKSILLCVLHEVIYTINKVFKSLISWPNEHKMHVVMVGFENYCGIPSIQGAINKAYISITKLQFMSFVEEYYYHMTLVITTSLCKMLLIQRNNLLSYLLAFLLMSPIPKY
jgi:hypothetical protein